MKSAVKYICVSLTILGTVMGLGAILYGLWVDPDLSPQGAIGVTGVIAVIVGALGIAIANDFL